MSLQESVRLLSIKYASDESVEARATADLIAFYQKYKNLIPRRFVCFRGNGSSVTVTGRNIQAALEEAGYGSGSLKYIGFVGYEEKPED